MFETPRPRREPATLLEAAAFYRVHYKTLQTLAQQERVPGAFKLGRKWRFDLGAASSPEARAAIAKRPRRRRNKVS